MNNKAKHDTHNDGDLGVEIVIAAYYLMEGWTFMYCSSSHATQIL